MPRVTDEFRAWALPGPGDLFDALLASARFEDLGTGRRGAVLVDCVDGTVPLVRTTTQYRAPAQPFRASHAQLAHAIAPSCNNALIEHYTSAYSTMKRHSDQALDLADDSTIAIYSCYRDPAQPSRRLVIKPKADGDARTLVLAHHSVVSFSLATNRRFTHTIALVERAPANDWLGLTFRTSKTPIRFVAGAPHFADGTPLTLAGEDERRSFFQLRRRENAELDFTYPPLHYTISDSDLRPPAP